MAADPAATLGPFFARCVDNEQGSVSTTRSHRNMMQWTREGFGLYEPEDNFCEEPSGDKAACVWCVPSGFPVRAPGRDQWAACLAGQSCVDAATGLGRFLVCRWVRQGTLVERSSVGGGSAMHRAFAASLAFWGGTSSSEYSEDGMTPTESESEYGSSEDDDSEDDDQSQTTEGDTDEDEMSY